MTNDEINLTSLYAPVAPWVPVDSPQPYEQIKLRRHECLVRTKPLAQGYLWQVNKKAGFCQTLIEARRWAELHLELVSGVMIGNGQNERVKVRP